MKMRIIFLILLTFCLVACVSAPPVISPEAAKKQQEEIKARRPETIAWRVDLIEASAEAKYNNKPVFVFVTCDYNVCKDIERSVMTSKAVVMELNQDFVAVREVVNTTPSEFALKYSVQAVPSYVFLNEDGKLLGKVAGKIDTISFLDLLDKIREAHKNS